MASPAIPKAQAWSASLTLLCVSIAFSATADIDLSARVEPSEILVGEPMRYVVTVTRPKDARADLPAIRGNTGRLDVEGYRAGFDTLPDGRVRETHALTLTAWIPGDDTLPPQRVEIRRAGDTAVTSLYTPATGVTVRATAPRGAKDIADIRDARRLPRSFPWGLPLLLAAIAGAWILIRRLRNRPKPVAPVTPTPAPVVTPEENALARLRDLEHGKLPSREFAFALSAILRGYLADRFGVDALEATTEELLERARPLPLRAGRDAWLRLWCETLDRVKFADAALSPADAERVVAEARDFVIEAAPENSAADVAATDEARPS